jgi:hypothetical protein
MRYKPVYVGKSKVHRQMWGIPVFWADENLSVVVAPDDLHKGSPGDCDQCAVALAARRQLMSPGVRIGLAHAYITVPMNSQGVEVEGFEGAYGVLAYELGAEARRIVMAVDRGEVEEITSGVTVTFRPRRLSERDEGKAAKNSRREYRTDQTNTRPQREEGVRNYAGRVWA